MEAERGTSLATITKWHKRQLEKLGKKLIVKRVDQETNEKRYNICLSNKCDRLSKDYECMACGCFISGKSKALTYLNIKTGKVEYAYCPMLMWDEKLDTFYKEYYGKQL